MKSARQETREVMEYVVLHHVKIYDAAKKLGQNTQQARRRMKKIGPSIDFILYEEAMSMDEQIREVNSEKRRRIEKIERKIVGQIRKVKADNPKLKNKEIARKVGISTEMFYLLCTKWRGVYD